MVKRHQASTYPGKFFQNNCWSGGCKQVTWPSRVFTKPLRVLTHMCDTSRGLTTTTTPSRGRPRRLSTTLARSFLIPCLYITHVLSQSHHERSTKTSRKVRSLVFSATLTRHNYHLSHKISEFLKRVDARPRYLNALNLGAV